MANDSSRAAARTQERSDRDGLGDFRLSGSMCRLLDLRASDIFVVKATYDIGL